MTGDGRKTLRKKVESIRVRYCTATQTNFSECESWDLSTGGAFLCTPHPLAPGTLVRLELDLEARPLRGLGRVVWKRDTKGPGDDTPAGMGIKFIKMDEATRRVIEGLPKRSPLW